MDDVRFEQIARDVGTADSLTVRTAVDVRDESTRLQLASWLAVAKLKELGLKPGCFNCNTAVSAIEMALWDIAGKGLSP
jgi:L-alanine-DL-glutamate epimerase-like enolase superfamily enzyme